MSKVIRLNHITKIEGHASLTLSIDNGEVKRCDLEAVEGSRYFEGMLKGRQYIEASEISSRICGICSCAHTICAIEAVENALEVKPSEQTVKLRVLLTAGERIRSHSTHLYFLALPDFLGYESALAMAPKYRKEVERALRLMKVGNDIVSTVVGRDLHPISATIGGFLKLPKQGDLESLKERLIASREDVIETAKLFSGLKLPKLDHEREYFSLRKPPFYAVLYGSIYSQSSKFTHMEYSNYIREYYEPDSTSNFVVKEGKTYMVGALSRINNNYEFLNDKAKAVAEECGVRFPQHNPFMNNFAQALELIHYIERCIELCDEIEIRQEKPVEYSVQAGHGIAAIEVPRGTLWHEYRIDKEGVITYANIITPTCQNLRSMQDDIRLYLPQLMDKPKDELVLEIEKLIRAYDPCFSCSTHFLKVNWV